MAGKPMFYTVRKHWKKSIFATCLASYGALYAVDKYREYIVRRDFCSRVIHLGQETTDALQLPRRLHVILNNQASGGNAAKLFEKNAAPLLHLAGIDVTVIKTDYEGHAKAMIGYIDPNTDGIVVAGGDGTVQEVVTGLLRESDEAFKEIPIGVIPLGKENRFFNRVFPQEARQVRQIGEATLAVIRGDVKNTDVLEISAGKRKSYALNSIHWGLFQQVKVKIDARKHWWAGPWKREMAFITRTSKAWPYSVQGQLSLRNSQPEIAQSNSPSAINKEITSEIKDINIDPSSKLKSTKLETDNSNSGSLPNNFQNFNSVGVHINLNTSEPSNSNISVEVWDSEMARSDFIKDGWAWLKANYGPIESHFAVKHLVNGLNLVPENDDESFYHIDGETYEARPIIVTLLRNKLRVFSVDFPKE